MRHLVRFLRGPFHLFVPANREKLKGRKDDADAGKFFSKLLPDLKYNIDSIGNKFRNWSQIQGGVPEGST